MTNYSPGSRNTSLVLSVAAVFLVLLVWPFSETKSPTFNEHREFQPLSFSDKKMLLDAPAETVSTNHAPTTEFSHQADSDPEEAQRYARMAWDLRMENPDVALHLISKALQLDDSDEIREKAEELLNLAAYTLEVDWAFDTESATSVAVSPDGNMIAIGNDYGEVYLLNSDGEELSYKSAHDNTIDGLSFSPDGEYLAVGSHDDYFSLWRIEDSELELDARHFYGNDWVRDLVFSSDGQELYVTGDMYYSLVYNTVSREVTDTLGGHDYYIYTIDVNDNDDVIVSGDGDGLLKVWQKSGGTWEESDATYLSGKVSDLHFLPGDEALAALVSGEVLRIDLSDPEDISTTAVISDEDQEYYAVTQLGDRIVAGGAGNRLEFIDDDTQGMVIVEDYVVEIQPWGDDQLLIASGYTLYMGEIKRSEVMSVEALKDGDRLPELTLDQKITYNLWTDDDVKDLDAEEKGSMFRLIADLMEGYGWEYTDLSALADLYVREAIDVIGEYMDGEEGVMTPLRVIMRTSGASPDFFNHALENNGKAAEMLQWLSLAGNEQLSGSFKRFATKRAYSFLPTEEWGQMLASNFSSMSSSLVEADMYLSYGCDANSAVFSPDGSYLFVTTDRGENCDGSYLYPVENGMPVNDRGISFPNQSGIMWQGSFSADGQRLASASTDGTVIIYNLNGGTEHIFANEGGDVGFTDARILRNGDVITTDAYGKVLRWSMGGIVPDDIIVEHEDEARKLALANDESMIISVGFDGILYMSTDEGTEEMDLEYGGIEDVYVSDDGSMALFGFVGGGAMIMDLETKELTRIGESEGVDFQSVAFSKDASTIFVGTEYGTLKAYNSSGILIWEKEIHDGAIYDLDVSPDGETIVAASGDDRVSVWKYSSLADKGGLWTTQPYAEHELSEPDWSQYLSFSGRLSNQDASLAMIQSLFDDMPRGNNRDNLEEAIDNSIFYKLNGRRISQKGGLKIYDRLPEGINGITWSEQLQAMVALGEDGAVFQLDDDGGFERIGEIDGASPRCFARMPDGRYAVADDDGIYILDEDLSEEERINPHNTTIYDISASADGAYIATASADYNLALIDAESLDYALVRGHSDEANAVVFLPDGSGIVSGADDATVKFWDLQGNLRRSTNVGSYVWSLDVSPDGDRIVAGTNNGELVILDGQGTEFKQWDISEYAFWSVTFSPDGESFAAGDNDGQVYVYGRDGEFIFSFDTGEYSIFEIAYSPDGKYIYVPSTEGVVFRLMIGE